MRPVVPVQRCSVSVGLRMTTLLVDEVGEVGAEEENEEEVVEEEAEEDGDEWTR